MTIDASNVGKRVGARIRVTCLVTAGAALFVFAVGYRAAACSFSIIDAMRVLPPFPGLPVAPAGGFVIAAPPAAYRWQRET